MRSFKHLKPYHLLPILLLATTLLAGLILPATIRGQTASQIDLVGPDGSGQFGKSVTVLPNGNVVVTDPGFDAGSVANVGAVYLYNGATRALISTLTGSLTNDQVGSDGVTVVDNGNYVVSSSKWNGSRGAVTWVNGSTGVSGAVSSTNSLVGSAANDQVGYNDSSKGGVTVLSNGNYVISSPYWDNGAITDAGAVTWGNGSIGISGAVSITNSLVGGAANDRVGYGSSSVITLNNGNYVVLSPNWDNGAVITDAGAVTWGDGSIGISGPISSTNSLVGGAVGDLVGNYGVTALSNDNYVVSSFNWDNGAVITDAGAVTWGNGTTGISGVVSSTNSLVGSTANDRVGSITVLSNGNYVVYSPKWDNGAITDVGAVTWGNGTTGISGVISSTNSLVGSAANDQVGGYGATPLSNGNYVVRYPRWDNGAITNAGAVTWVNGTTGISGTVSTTNSLVGGAVDDRVGQGSITALNNGNYVVSNPYWGNSRGAVTWGKGATGISGVVSSTNSLVGSTDNDYVGYNVTALSNGNYVVSSFFWDNGAIIDAGAVTWGNGSTGISGVVSSTNSLVGSGTYDMIGRYNTIALSNGNYVVLSSDWDNGAITEAGAVTWGNGSTGISGPVSTTNSLVGSAVGDLVGEGYNSVTALSNGNYVVRSSEWDNGAVTNVGAVTWGNGATGISGAVSSTNSLVGSTASDWVGDGVTPLSNGNYVVFSPHWDNGAVTDAGAVTWGDDGVVGTITAENSVRGTAANGGSSLVFAYDKVHHQLIVGRPADNIVTFFDCPFLDNNYLPIVIK